MRSIWVILASILFLFVIAGSANAAKTNIFKVTNVVDGDTIKIVVRGNNETVRLLGIDTPESVDPRTTVQCFSKEATKKLESLVSGKEIIVIDEKSQGNRDKYNRLLRWIYLPDNKKTFVNGEMVKQGYAHHYREYPTSKYDNFEWYEKYAKTRNLGLWGSCNISKAPTKTPIKIETKTNSNNSAGENNQAGSYVCNCSKTCGSMVSCDEAYYQLKTCGCSARDGDSDGIPCESLCR